MASLRQGRLARLQASMRTHGVDACLLFNPANVRYATGATTMTVYCLGSFVRCALVPAEGRPILFEYPNSMHLFTGIEAEVRPFHAWEFFEEPASEAEAWARETVAALRQLGVSSDRLAVDKLAPVAMRALAAEGIELTDSGTVTMDARSVKTPEEVALFRQNGSLVMEMLAAFEQALAPGARECDLVAVVTDSMLRGGGEYLITRGVASGPNTNPWRQDATDRVIEEGDVAYLDTDVNGIEGYFSCVSRSFICGGGPATTEQKEVYAIARDWLVGVREFIRPGVGFRDFADRVPKLPERFTAQRYECLLHSCGLEDEGPSISYPDVVQPNPDRALEKDMVVVNEVYLGEVGGSFGIKLGEQYLITEDGSECLAPYPFSASF